MTPVPLQEAIDYALTNSLIKFNSRFELVHAPMALAPYEIPRNVHEQIIVLTPLYNQLMLNVALASDFLTEHLTLTSHTDPFIEELLDIHQNTSNTQPLQLMINRNDYMLTKNANPSAPLLAKQVEFNTISASYPFLISRMTRLHQFLFRNHEWGDRLVENDPISGIVSVMAETVRQYGHANACLLTIVQPREQNIFDQRGGEYQLWDQYRIPTLRMTLEEVANEGFLREGHLVVRDQVAAITYFRAGYTPDDYPSTDAWKARRLIDTSSTVAVPTIAMQLAGMKKIQQVLTAPDILRKFAEPSAVPEIESTFVGLYLLDERVNRGELEDSAANLACQFPHQYVLKPQREGGGNNLYDEDMVARLQSIGSEERYAYILMERIQSVEHPTILVTEGKLQNTSAVSEIGRFGVCLSEGKEIRINQDVGYLVRTKAADQNEGGVSAGYACLNTLCTH